MPFLAVRISYLWPRYVFVDQVMKIVTLKNLINLVDLDIEICSLFERGSKLVEVKAS
jgi:hypothetical protein